MSDHDHDHEHHAQPDDSTTIIGHPDAGVIAGPSQWKTYAAAGAFVAVLAGGVTYGLTRGGDEPAASPPEADLVDAPFDDPGTDALFDESSEAPLIGPDDGEGTAAEDPVDDQAAGASSDEPNTEVPTNTPTNEIISDGDAPEDMSAAGPADGGPIWGDPLSSAPFEPAESSGLREICIDVRHQEVPDQNAPSGIWVDGELYGLAPGTWIWVQGPTINGGDGVEIPIVDGRFEAPLGIDAFGEHPIDGFELRDADGHPVVDLLGQLQDGPGTTITVGPDEGAPFDEPCFQFEPLVPTDDAGAVGRSAPPAPPAADPSTADQSTADQSTGDQSTGDQSTADPSTADPSTADQSTGDQSTAGELDSIDHLVVAETFFSDFVAAHVAGDSDLLIERLHPPMRDAFGPVVCDDYVRSTTGSIVAATVGRVGEPALVEFAGPNGDVSIPEALPVQVDLVLGDGTVMPTDAHLVLGGDEVHWLTRCGVD